MESVISVSGLGKKYLLSHQSQERYQTLRDTLAHQFRRIISDPGEKPDALRKKEEFWALKDVSFEINEGDRVGIIGRNGAGKSTLLRLLSRITEPTAGKIQISGRVASLLEVGTGFHMELTGRENIYLNGAILGMSRDLIQKRFDEIVYFSGVEKFLDTPVKRYSSGMYARLAFSVAAHLDCEILVVDEVLAVGDVAFQKKCLGKMSEIGHSGRTVLFVSHNMGAVEHLCSSAMMLDNGRIVANSRNVRQVIDRYLGAGEAVGAHTWVNRDSRYKNNWFFPSRMLVADEHNEGITGSVRNDSECWIQIEGEILNEDPALQVGYALYAEDGSLLYWTCHTDSSEQRWPKLHAGRSKFRCRLPKRFLNEGVYRIELFVALYYREWLIEPGNNAPSIRLEISGGLSDSPYWFARRPGTIAPVLEWETSPL